MNNLTVCCPEQKPYCNVLKKRSKSIAFVADKPSLRMLQKGGFLVFHCHGPRFKYGKFIFIVTTEKQYEEWGKAGRKQISDYYKAEAENKCCVLSKKAMDFLLYTLCNKDQGPYVTFDVEKYKFQMHLFSTMYVFPTSKSRPD